MCACYNCVCSPSILIWLLYVIGPNSKYFSLEFHYKDYLFYPSNETLELQYFGKGIGFVDWCQRGKLSLLKIDMMIKELKVDVGDAEIYYFWKKPGKSIADGLVNFSTDLQRLELVYSIPPTKSTEVYL